MIRLLMIALGFGFASGLAAGVTFFLMHELQRVIAGFADAPWRIFAAVLCGAALIGAIRSRLDAGTVQDINGQIADTVLSPTPRPHRHVFWIAAISIISIGFGAALGPEAGLIAVTSELARIVASKVARSREETRFIAATGIAGGLGGLYASPAGAAVMVDEDMQNESSRKPGATQQRDWTHIALLSLAAVAGLIGFALVLKGVHGEGLRLALPEANTSDIVAKSMMSVLPAVLGSIMGMIFIVTLRPAQKLVGKLPENLILQSVIASVPFAILAAIFPLIRHSGVTELHSVLAAPMGLGAGTLLLLAVLKVLASANCLVAGWRGGVIYPLIFSGAAAGGAIAAALPFHDPTVAMIAGITASATLGMGKPIAAILIVLVVVNQNMVLPIMVGAAVAFLFIGQFKLHPPALH